MSHVSGTSDFTGWMTQDDPYSQEFSRTTRVQKLFLTIWLEESSNGRPNRIMLSDGNKFHYVHVSIDLTSEILLQY
jgi:hypothetical protein